MGRVKQSRLNSSRNRTRTRARFRAGLGPAFVPTRNEDGYGPLMRLRTQARSVLSRQSRSD